MVKFDITNGVGDEENGGVTVDSFKEFINANKNEDIQIDINTLGGDLDTALVIHDLLKSHPKQTKANIYGLTASAGTVIALGCDEVEISPNALFLIHNSLRGPVSGNVYDFQKAASDLMKTDAIMVKIYREKTGLDDNIIKDLMKAEDWMSPTEAEQYGFIDRILPSGVKIAASVILAKAKSKINNQLLIKLEEKMKNPFKKEDKQTLNVLALKDGNSVLINAETPETGTEVAPIGAMTLEDGEYELADGRKILVAGGVITEVVEEQPPVEGDAAAETEALVAAVSEVVIAEIATVKAELQKEFKAELAKISSKHTPVKGTVIVTPKAKVDIAERINAVTEKIHTAIVESRKK